MKFSQRLGITKSIKLIQKNTMDDDLKNGLWNTLKMDFLDKLEHHNGWTSSLEYKNFGKRVWHDFFKLPIDCMPAAIFDIEQEIREYFFRAKWYEIYNFIEFVVQSPPGKPSKINFINSLNSILEREFSAYRIIGDKATPISNQLEFDELNEALERTQCLTALKGANLHLTKSIELISDKKNPDYRNSVKESISAVESACRVITEENTLGKALNKLESKGITINSQLKNGFERIYAYTNDKENGIRHAIVTEPIEPDLSDAKYMLIACSSFINFLVSKAEKYGINIG